MPLRAIQHQLRAFMALVLALTISCGVHADPPSRVGRLGYTAGAVSFSPAGQSDWDQATVNRPLTNGDRLWTDEGARAEIQLGAAMVRMNGKTSAAVINLDDRIAQLQLTQGTLNVHVRRLDPNQVFEVDTPNLAFTLRQAGAFRIEVGPDSNATTIIVRQGRGEAYGEGAAYVIDSRQPYRFTGVGLRNYQHVAAPRLDDFDRWSNERDRFLDHSGSARYVSPDVVGYQDLDANGTWRQDTTYGNIWIPNRVAADWTPYSDGHWAWVDPWGWTWVDDQPWGFAVSHYGRWTNRLGTWGWVPGPVHSRAYYAPALVAFVGGNNVQLTISSGPANGVAWFPLAPREVYRPAYPASRRYVDNINRSNTVINNTVIRNTYNTTNVSQVVYANRHVPGAVIAVPRTVFEQSHPVSKALVHMPRDALVHAPVAGVAPVAPTEKSVRGAASAGGHPPERVFERPVIARTAAPSAPIGFMAQQPQLATKPGHPLGDAARKELKAPVTPSPQQRPAQPPAAPLAHVNPPLQQAPMIQKVIKPEPAPAPHQTEQHPPLMAPQAPPATPPQQAPHAQPRGQNPRSDANRPFELKKDKDEPRHEEDKRKQKEPAN